MSDKAFEAYAKETYEAATKRIYLETLAAAKAVRPEAKWGYFQYPQWYYGSSKTPAGTIGYPSPEVGSVATKINDGLAWLFEAVDVVVPAPYAPRITASDAEAKALKLARKDSHAPDIAERYYRSNIREAVRVARGKPVLPILRLRYYQDNTTWLRTPDVEIPLAMAKEEGAAGVMLWENVRTPAGDAELRTFADTILKPAVVHSAWMRAPRSP